MAVLLENVISTVFLLAQTLLVLHYIFLYHTPYIPLLTFIPFPFSLFLYILILFRVLHYAFKFIRSFVAALRPSKQGCRQLRFTGNVPDDGVFDSAPQKHKPFQSWQDGRLRKKKKQWACNMCFVNQKVRDWPKGIPTVRLSLYNLAQSLLSSICSFFIY